MRASTQKLTTAAVCTALAVIMCVFTAYLPLSFMPLYIAAFCIFLACKRGSLTYGLLCAAASIGLMFLMSGLSVKWLAFVVMFAPYGILAYFMHRFTYMKWKSALLRLVITIAYFNATFAALYLITVNVASVGIEGLNIVEWSARVGGYAVLAVIMTVVLTPLDFILSTMSLVVLKKIPAPVTRRDIGKAAAPPEAIAEEPHVAVDADNPEKKVDDVFGYEIIDDKDADKK